MKIQFVLRVIALMFSVALMIGCQRGNLVDPPNAGSENLMNISRANQNEGEADFEGLTDETEFGMEATSNYSALSGRMIIGTRHALYVYNFETGEITNLLDDVSATIFNISCNDKGVWFLNTRNLFDQSITAENDTADVYSININGDGLERITDNEVAEFNLEISNDNKYVLYEQDSGYLSSTEDSRYQMFLFIKSNSERIGLTKNENGFLGKISPDSRFIAVLPFDEKPISQSIYVYDTESLAFSILPIGGDIDVVSFEWFPDQTSFLINADSEEGNVLYRMDILSGEISEILRYDDFIEEYTLSSDGTQILVSTIEIRENSDGGIRKLLLTNVETGESILIKEGGIDSMVGSYLPAWSPDGNHFAYLQNGINRNEMQVFVIDSASVKMVDMISYYAGDTIYMKWILSQ
jgi:Tol biopolymer transport system component